jgi:hypothetical protein
LLVNASKRHSFGRPASQPIAANTRKAILKRPLAGSRTLNGESSSNSDPLDGHTRRSCASNTTGANTSTQSITRDPCREKRSSPVSASARSRRARSRATPAASRSLEPAPTATNASAIPRATN